MSSRGSLRNDYLLVGEEAPGWLAFGLLSLGGVSVMLALWLLVPPDLYSVVGPASTSSLQEKDDSGSSAPVAGAGPPRAAAAAKNESTGELEILSDTVGLAEIADNSAAHGTSPKPVPSPPEEKPAAPLAKASGAFGSILMRPCPPVFTFTFARNSVTPAVADRLNEIAYLRDWLGNHPQAKLVLEGHTDALGPEEYNLLLSHRRARTVATILTKAGLPGERLFVRAFGEQLPLTDSVATSPENRRVSVRTEGSDQCPKPQ